ncbi:uncharacterized protein RCC_00778 [Ramularia collo-cygni]|uniref:Uncharacterized protein n=1 Tax=Ramularia collo-cygni TaxID=112498 RepID=A0A2D3UPK0_9PEZI|nr:uncharacterized protein RCC_00778 [Ramularia collo-cygni]CZT14835.1 uncharacterized protein RCC_00778 [Ramularia collo-cygni]
MVQPAPGGGPRASASNKKRKAEMEEEVLQIEGASDVQEGRKRIRSVSTAWPYESDAKIYSLDYGKTIEVTVFRNKQGISPVVKEVFRVDEALLFRGSPYIRRRITIQGDKTNYEIFDGDPADFKFYLNWIYGKALSVVPVEDGGGSLFREQRSRLGQDDQPDAGVSSLCDLLRFAFLAIRDFGFIFQVLRVLGERALTALPGSVSISVADGVFIWGLRHRPGARFIRRRIPEWMAPGLTREEIEQSGQFLKSDLLKALRELLPHTKLTIRIGAGENAQTLTVDRSLAIRRSTLLSTVLKAGGSMPSELPPAQITLDESGTATLSGEYSANLLRDWAETLTEEGKELKSLLSRYNNLKIDQVQADECKRALCALWILAEALGDRMLQKTIITALLTDSNGEILRTRWVTPEIIAMVYERLPSSSGLRRLIVSIISSSIVRQGMKSNTPAIPTALLMEILIKTREISGIDKGHKHLKLATYRCRSVL